ncbi:MAG: hypothetical protein COB83_07220 [Gammaproteobacteria bacterium]|nr:MAG: hypothetical protein COB83_07220 [Gammaproteobacteria bacterium]
MEELYINGERVYLSDRVVARTLQINDFREVKDRQANYSNNIKIPRTPENIKTFQFLGIDGNTSTIAYESISVKYVLDGIEMATNGKGIIKATNEFYDFNFYDGNISMSDLLGNNTLSSLDYTSYNHNLSFNTFFASFSSTGGYVYGLDGDFMNDLNSISPSFYIHTLFDMIFTQKGWSISGAIFSDSDYLSRVTTMNMGFDQTLTPSFVNKYSQVNTDMHVAGNSIPFTSEFLVDSYTSLSDDVYNVSFSGNISVTFGTITLDIRVNGNSKGIITDVLTSITDIIGVFAENGDVITVYAVGVAEEFDPTDFRVNFTEAFTTSMDVDNSYYDINFEDIIGNTKQIDFVKDVLQRFNLSFRKVRNENTIEFVTSEALLVDKANAENWTSKYSSKIDEVTKSGYAKENNFKYIYDQDGNDFADGIMTLTDVNLNETKTLVTSIFKASSKVSGIYGINLWDRVDNEFTPTQDGLRIFKINTNTANESYRLKYGVGNYIQINTSKPDLDFSALSYQNEVDNNYTEFTNLIDKYKLLSAEINLSLIDIYQLDFFKLKYFEQTGKFYYLNKVISFKNNKTTKVELIEIPI